MIDHNLLVITYYYDLPNFRMFLYLLNKFWKGKKKITIVCNLFKDNDALSKDDILPEIQDAVSLLDSDWEYEIRCGVIGQSASSYSYQQIYKLYYSSSMPSAYTVVFDCKNFLINDLSIEGFFVDGKMLVDLAARDDSWIALTQRFFPVDGSTRYFNPYTPWVWKNSDVSKTIEHLERKLGNLIDLPTFDLSEYMAVMLYKTTVLNQEDDIQLARKRRFPVLYHHLTRNINNVDTTARKLGTLGVPSDEVTRWTGGIRQSYIEFTEYHKYNDDIDTNGGNMS